MRISFQTYRTTICARCAIVSCSSSRSTRPLIGAKFRWHASKHSVISIMRYPGPITAWARLRWAKVAWMGGTIWRRGWR
jgi:hypothetical protein